MGALGANYYQQFLLIVQLVAGKHMLNPQSVAEKHVFFRDHETKDIRTIFVVDLGLGDKAGPNSSSKILH